jgi:SAM-dependent methyltransferase
VSLAYRILYRLGITPWERDEVPEPVAHAAAGASKPGRALDLGCGTGRDAVHLAQQGWTVTGVDAVPKALGEARERARKAAAEVDFRHGDVTRLEQLGLEPGFDLVLDRGCFHGLGDEERDRCAGGVNRLTAPGAELLIFAFSPGWHGPAPRGISAEEIVQRFGPGDWELVETTSETPRGVPPWLRNTEMSWHRLRRTGQQRASASA